jgi:predicted aspartyl protease
VRFMFNPHHGLIVVGAELHGPSGSIILRLALDTGASTTMVSIAPLVAAGHDPALAGERVQVTTAAGVEFVPRLEIARLNSLGCDRADLAILGHTLPPSAGVDGLLGLDFLRGQELNIDFRKGTVTLQ